MKVEDTLEEIRARTAKSNFCFAKGYRPSTYFLREDFFVAGVDAAVAEVEEEGEPFLGGCCCCWARRFEYVLLAFAVLALTPTPLALVLVLALGSTPEPDPAASRSPSCWSLVSLPSAPPPPPARQPDSLTFLFRFRGRFSPRPVAASAGSLEDLVIVANTAAAAPVDVDEDDGGVATPRDRLPGVPTADVGVVVAAVVVFVLLLAVAKVDGVRALCAGRLTNLGLSEP